MSSKLFLKGHDAFQFSQTTAGLLAADFVSFPSSLSLAPKYNLPYNTVNEALQDVIDPTVQKELIEEGCGKCDGNCCKLLPFRTPTDHNCLCHSACIATCGTLDTDHTLRKAISQNMEGSSMAAQYFKEQWMHAMLERDRLGFGMEIERSNEEWAWEWQQELAWVQDEHSSLTEIHVFVLAHVLRRPIVVYSSAFSKDVDGCPLAPVYFGGIYLPVLLAPEECSPIASPIMMAYARSHFSALIPLIIKAQSPAVAPLVDASGTYLPIQYVDQSLFAPGSDSWKDLLGKYLTLHKGSEMPHLGFCISLEPRCLLEDDLLSHCQPLCSSTDEVVCADLDTIACSEDTVNSGSLTVAPEELCPHKFKASNLHASETAMATPLLLHPSEKGKSLPSMPKKFLAKPHQLQTHTVPYEAVCAQYSSPQKLQPTSPTNSSKCLARPLSAPRIGRKVANGLPSSPGSTWRSSSHGSHPDASMHGSPSRIAKALGSTTRRQQGIVRPTIGRNISAFFNATSVQSPTNSPPPSPQGSRSSSPSLAAARAHPFSPSLSIQFPTSRFGSPGGHQPSSHPGEVQMEVQITGTRSPPRACRSERPPALEWASLSASIDLNDLRATELLHSPACSRMSSEVMTPTYARAEYSSVSGRPAAPPRSRSPQLFPPPQASSRSHSPLTQTSPQSHARSQSPKCLPQVQAATRHDLRVKTILLDHSGPGGPFPFPVSPSHRQQGYMGVPSLSAPTRAA